MKQNILYALLAIVAVAIFYFAVGFTDDDYQDRMDADTDFPAKEEARVDLVRTCQIKQYSELHEFDCVVINKQLARAL